MSITDELREYVIRVHRNGWLDKRVCDDLLDIADRIDVAHRSALKKVAAIVDHDGWVELPVDADGVPTHVGDKIKLEHNGRVTTVTNINYNKYGWQVYCAEGGGFDKDTRFRHVQPDSWERIIEDARVCLMSDYKTEATPTMRWKSDIESLVERCRRLAGE